MLSKSEILITKRFLFSKKSEGYVSIFSWFSIIGISLGVAAIIIVMSVMNGFRSNLTERLLGVNSHLNVYSFNEKINLEELQKNWKKSRSSFSNLIKELDQKNLDKLAIFRHPLMGRINLAQTLYFFELHQNHHLKQIEKKLTILS